MSFQQISEDVSRGISLLHSLAWPKTSTGTSVLTPHVLHEYQPVQRLDTILQIQTRLEEIRGYHSVLLQLSQKLDNSVESLLAEDHALNNAQTPIHSLPDEVLRPIFRLSTADATIDAFVTPAVSLAQVCRRWRGMVSSDYRVWSPIRMQWQTPQILRHLNNILIKKNLPLSIELCHWAKRAPTIAGRTMERLARRLKRLTILSDSTEFHSLGDIFGNKRDPPIAMDVLEELQIIARDPDTGRPVPANHSLPTLHPSLRFPSLSKLYLEGICISGDIGAPSLRELTISNQNVCDLAALVELLHHFPSLMRLHIEDVDEFYFGRNWSSVLNFIHLKEVTIKMVMKDLLTPLLSCLDASSIVSFHVLNIDYCTWSELPPYDERRAATRFQSELFFDYGSALRSFHTVLREKISSMKCLETLGFGASVMTLDAMVAALRAEESNPEPTAPNLKHLSLEIRSSARHYESRPDILAFTLAKVLVERMRRGTSLERLQLPSCISSHAYGDITSLARDVVIIPCVCACVGSDEHLLYEAPGNLVVGED
ncbi:hypothetical protein DL93DRAFT_2170835 [Clavulina sp. PMI_390]|nr:hypothetical protein DL93DRAFT_2170835 [Clavulina sp. PMI_390]